MIRRNVCNCGLSLSTTIFDFGQTEKRFTYECINQLQSNINIELFGDFKSKSRKIIHVKRCTLNPDHEV